MDSLVALLGVSSSAAPTPAPPLSQKPLSLDELLRNAASAPAPTAAAESSDSLLSRLLSGRAPDIRQAALSQMAAAGQL